MKNTKKSIFDFTTSNNNKFDKIELNDNNSMEKRTRGRRDWEKNIELKSRLKARGKNTINERIKITNKWTYLC